MPEAPTAYPLAWPPGWPRTQYPSKGPYKSSLPAALDNLKREVRLLAGASAADGLVLSSNVTLGKEAPKDAGVVAFFRYERDQVAIPCDRWAAVAQNVQAIALTIESMRAIERHGAKHMVKAMFRGFTALPAPDDWRAVLGNPGSLAEAEAAWKERMRSAHPDAGGSAARAAELNAAIASARREFSRG